MTLTAGDDSERHARPSTLLQQSLSRALAVAEQARLAPAAFYPNR